MCCLGHTLILTPNKNYLFSNRFNFSLASSHIDYSLEADRGSFLKGLLQGRRFHDAWTPTHFRVETFMNCFKYELFISFSSLQFYLETSHDPENNYSFENLIVTYSPSALTWEKLNRQGRPNKTGSPCELCYEFQFEQLSSSSPLPPTTVPPSHSLLFPPGLSSEDVSIMLIPR